MIKNNNEGLEKASSLLKDGRLVAFPTETVYGLGANALDVEAVLSIFRAKGRPLSDPLIVHVSDVSSCERLVDLDEEENGVFRLLSGRFWPGPMTIIVRASKLIPLKVTADTGFVGLRSPRHPLARRLLEVCGLPLAAPSANRFGHVSPTTAAHVLADLGEKDVAVLDGDSDTLQGDTCAVGIESTVAKIDTARKVVTVLRQGAVSEADIYECLMESGYNTWQVEALSRVVKMHSSEDTPSSSSSSSAGAVGEQAPGQAITHYAPDVPCFLHTSIAPGVETRVMIPEDAMKSLVVIDFGGQLVHIKDACRSYTDLAPTGVAEEGARNLFSALRKAENVSGADMVLVASVSVAAEQPLGLGLADRIMRATSGRSLHLRIEA